MIEQRHCMGIRILGHDDYALPADTEVSDAFTVSGAVSVFTSGLAWGGSIALEAEAVLAGSAAG